MHVGPLAYTALTEGCFSYAVLPIFVFAFPSQTGLYVRCPRNAVPCAGKVDPLQLGGIRSWNAVP